MLPSLQGFLPQSNRDRQENPVFKRGLSQSTSR
jgi:hypothetical protein